MPAAHLAGCPAVSFFAVQSHCLVVQAPGSLAYLLADLFHLSCALIFKYLMTEEWSQSHVQNKNNPRPRLEKLQSRDRLIVNAAALCPAFPRPRTLSSQLAVPFCMISTFLNNMFTVQF